jgi:drug/metabolite transporter (DMT)-like permease
MMPDMTPSDRLHRRGLTAVWLATFVWAWGPVVVKWSDLPGPTFAMLRLWAGVCISLTALAVTRRRLTWHAFRACAFGGVLFAADIGLGFTAIKATTVADVAIIGALAPVVIVVVSAYRLGERVTLRAWLLAGVSFTGVVIVALASAGSPSWSLTGDALAFLSIGTWSLYWFFSRHVRERFDPIVYFACVMLAGAIAMTPVALATEGLPTAVSRGDLFAVVAVALLPGFVGHTLVIWSHKHVASWLSALITQVSPVITAVLAWLALGEALTPAAVVGVALTVGATMVIVAVDGRRASVPDLEDAAEKVS